MDNKETTIQEKVQNVLDYNKKLEIANAMMPALTTEQKEDLKDNIEKLRTEVFEQ